MVSGRRTAALSRVVPLPFSVLKSARHEMAHTKALNMAICMRDRACLDLAVISRSVVAIDLAVTSRAARHVAPNGWNCTGEHR